MNSNCRVRLGRQSLWSATSSGLNPASIVTVATAWLSLWVRFNPARCSTTSSGSAATTPFVAQQAPPFSTPNFSIRRECSDEDVYPDSSGDTDPPWSRCQTTARTGAHDLFCLRGLVVRRDRAADLRLLRCFHQGNGNRSGGADLSLHRPRRQYPRSPPGVHV